MNIQECENCGLLIEPVIEDISGIGDEVNWQIISEEEDMCTCSNSED